MNGVHRINFYWTKRLLMVNAICISYICLQIKCVCGLRILSYEIVKFSRTMLGWQSWRHILIRFRIVEKNVKWNFPPIVLSFSFWTKSIENLSEGWNNYHFGEYIDSLFRIKHIGLIGYPMFVYDDGDYVCVSTHHFHRFYFIILNFHIFQWSNTDPMYGLCTLQCAQENH